MIKEYCDLCKSEMTDKQKVVMILAFGNPYSDIKDLDICVPCYKEVNNKIEELNKE